MHCMHHAGMNQDKQIGMSSNTNPCVSWPMRTMNLCLRKTVSGHLKPAPYATHALPLLIHIHSVAMTNIL
jgi:hypothetical protein